jgi:hypothetical protein
MTMLVSTWIMPTPPGWRVADEEVVSELLPQVVQRRAQGVARRIV